ncbi:NAD-dependent epimerase/dehydratase family protein [Neorhodopirellula lusitana]|uniref:NAD-dependent epimerase/dehydratase family protein n=1 Tax=Neorhodopirellula lusitana TaxID=445327 RepID=UPI0038501C7F
MRKRVTSLAINQELVDERILITGGLGCIGSATVKWLLLNSQCQILVGVREVDPDRARGVLGAIDRSRITLVKVDVRDPDQVLTILDHHRVTRVVHLAGLQTPDCNEHRDLGLQVNLGGTQNVIEAIKAAASPLRRFVFASSMAVYGPRSSYPAGTVAMDSALCPVNVYGTWKLAGEQLTRLLHQETGIDAISLRPGALFGPGRDTGLTATPTTAMKHVAQGLPYQIPYSNHQDYQYVPDVGAAFGNAILEPFSGCGALTLPGHCLTTHQLVQEMREAAKLLGLSDRFQISVGSETVPFICEIDSQAIVAAFPKLKQTPVRQAVHDSIEFYVSRLRNGQTV